jgi:hypothetical protein
MIEDQGNPEKSDSLLSTFFFGDLFPTFRLFTPTSLSDTYRSAWPQRSTVTCPVWKDETIHGGKTQVA